MAAGWPTKVTYADGDVFSAAYINDTNGTINYIDPTSATDKQVLTRDAASGGKVKWADSPANTLTTTGDLYYASSANTPARLAIGSTNQVLTVAGGVPTWAAGSSTYTKIGSTVTFSNVASQAFDNVFSSTYKSYWVNIENIYAASGSVPLAFQFRYAGPTTKDSNNYSNSFYMPYTGTNVSTVRNNTANGYIANLIGADTSMNAGNFYCYGVGQTTKNAYIMGNYVNSASAAGMTFNIGTSGSAGQNTYTGFILSASSNITGSVSIYGVS
jgi:hypothetical protein